LRRIAVVALAAHVVLVAFAILAVLVILAKASLQVQK